MPYHDKMLCLGSSRHQLQTAGNEDVSRPEMPVVSASELAAIADVVSETFGSHTLDAVFEQNGFSAELLRDPVRVFSNAEYMRFLEACARESGQPLLGAMIGDATPFSELGLYGRYVVSAPSLPLALTRASKALKYHENGSALTFKFSAAHFRIDYKPATPNALGSRHQADGVAAMLVNLVKLYLGPDWLPDRILLVGATGQRQRDLERFFKTPVVAGNLSVSIEGATSIELTPSDPIDPPIGPLTFQELRRLIRNSPPMSFGETLRQLMDTFVRDGIFDLNEVAGKINFGARTIQRRLAFEGTSFTRLLANARCRYAEELLVKSDLTVAELSELLGFSSRQHFIRAFKSWADISPGQFRLNAQERTWEDN